MKLQMVHKLGLCLVAGVFAAIPGCGPAIPPPSAAQLAHADYGPFPADYQFQIQLFWMKRLVDPGSAKFKYAKPKKGFTQRIRNRNTFCYVVVHTVEAKGRSGRYSTPKKHAAYFIDGHLSHVTETEKKDGYYPLVDYNRETLPELQ